MIARRIPIIAGAILLVLWAVGGVDRLREATTDWRFTQTTRPATGAIAIVAIDAKSLQTVSVWPWPRSVHAELLAHLQALGVGEVAFDVDFSARTTATEDAAFAKALRDVGGSTILPVFKQIVRSHQGIEEIATAPRPEFARESWLASVNVRPETNGLLRRYQTGDEINGTYYPSIAALLAGYSGPSFNQFLIDFGIDLRSIPVFSVADVLAGRVPADLLRGKKVIVGATAVELGDHLTAPGAGIVAGALIQALAAETILQGRMLQPTGLPLTLAGLLVLAMASMALTRFLAAPAATVTLIVVAFLVEAMALSLQLRAPVVLDTAAWQLAIASVLLASWINELDLRSMLVRIAQRRFESIAGSLADGVICANDAGCITYCNTAAEALFRFSSAEVAGKPIGAFLAGFSVDGFGSDPHELTGLRTDGTTFPVEVRVRSWDADDGRNFSAVVRDITSRKEAQERIRYLALHDGLTGLANRVQLCDAIRTRIETAPARRFAVLLLDLDNFKEVNDTLGHESGDRILCTFAAQLRERLGPDAVIARFGGDEFALAVDTDRMPLDRALAAIADILGPGDRATRVDGRSFLLSTSVGYALYPRHGGTVDDLLSRADVALFQSKRVARGLATEFQQQMMDELQHRRELESRLRQAVDAGELEVFYQPQVRLADGHVAGAESLLRWRHPERGLVTPADFLDVLGTSAIATAVGDWIMRESMRQAAAWARAGHPICVGINLFPAQFTHDLPAQIAARLAEFAVPSHLVEIEITENILLNDNEMTIRLLQGIRALGVRVALDDFGTGFASLTHLRTLPLDRLKIDRSFVSGLGADRANTAIVGSVVHLGQALGLEIIVEGIEDEASVALLQAMGCTHGQGYLWGRPMPASEIEARLASRDVAAA